MCAEPLARGALASPPRQVPTSTPEQMFHANLELIEKVIRFVASHYRLSAQERDEFASDVRLRLIDNDYAVLKKFEQRSNLQTFLASVITRIYFDYRDKQWGKWRPSAEAKRLGPVATLLERKMVRDKLPFGEAVESMRTNHGVTESREELYALLQKLPPRTPRTMVGEQALDEVEGGLRGDDVLIARERADRRRRAIEAVDRAVKCLPDQDATIFQLHYLQGAKVAEIARMMTLDQKKLYRRIEGIRETVQHMLEEEGFTPADLFGDVPEEPDDPETGG